MAHEDECCTPFLTLSLLHDASAVFPPEAQPSAHDAAPYRLLERSSFSVCEGGRTLFRDRLDNGNQSTVARGGDNSAELLLGVRTPHGVSTWGESLLTEVIACDLGNRPFDLILAEPAHGGGSFDSHVATSVAVKEVNALRVHRHGPDTDPVVGDPPLLRKDFAFSLTSAVKPLARWGNESDKAVGRTLRNFDLRAFTVGEIRIDGLTHEIGAGSPVSRPHPVKVPRINGVRTPRSRHCWRPTCAFALRRRRASKTRPPQGDT
jgi:hypothetical protein